MILIGISNTGSVFGEEIWEDLAGCMIFGVVLFREDLRDMFFFAWSYGDLIENSMNPMTSRSQVFTELLSLLTHIFKHLSVPVGWKGAADGKAILISEPLKRLVPQLDSLNFPYMSSV